MQSGAVDTHDFVLDSRYRGRVSGDISETNFLCSAVEPSKRFHARPRKGISTFGLGPKYYNPSEN